MWHYNPELLVFPGHMSTLENATKTTVEQISNEINAIDNRIKKIKKKIELPKTEPDIKYRMDELITTAERNILMLRRALKEPETIFSWPTSLLWWRRHFCEKFVQAVKDNFKHRIQEEQAGVR